MIPDCLCHISHGPKCAQRFLFCNIVKQKPQDPTQILNMPQRHGSMVSVEAVASCICKKPCLPALSSNPERPFVCGHPALSCPCMKPQTFDPLCPWRPLYDIEPFQSFLSCS